MIAYKQSDIKLSWTPNATLNSFPKVCGYVKEGAGILKKFIHFITLMIFIHVDGCCLRLAELERDNDLKQKKVLSSKNNRTSFLSDHLFKHTEHSRYKRQADQYEYTPTKTRCPLLLVADYRFFQEMGSGNTKTTINYLVSCNEFEVYRKNMNSN